MNKKIIKDTLDELNPTIEQSAQMWERLSKTVAQQEQIHDTDEKESVSSDRKEENRDIDKKTSIKKLNPLATVAAAVAVVVITFIGGNIATDGVMYAKIKELLSFNQGKQDVVGSMTNKQHIEKDVYAQPVYYLDENTLIFGTLRGVVIYDLQQNTIGGIIDTIKIDCVYYNSDEKNTCILKEKDELLIFNTEHDKIVGNYYAYDLNQCKGQELPIAKSGNEDVLLIKYYDLWKKHRLNYVDTHESFSHMSEISEKILDDDNRYSATSYVWKDKTGKENTSFLLIEKEKYNLITYNAADKEFTYRPLNMEISSLEVPKSESVELKQFVYNGKNPAIKAIYEYMEPQYREEYEAFEQIYIPAYTIYKEVEIEDEYLVFGNFYIYSYLLTGNVLESTHGNEMPACFHLKKDNENYRVVRVDVAQDGTYKKDIKHFTRDYPGLYKTFLNYNEKKNNKARQKYLQMYVQTYDLDIKYYKDYGWDSVPIFGELAD